MSQRLLSGVCAGLICLLSFPANLQADTPQPDSAVDDILSSQATPAFDLLDVAEFRHVLVEWAIATELAFAPGSRLSEQLIQASPEELRFWMESAPDLGAFMDSLERVTADLKSGGVKTTEKPTRTAALSDATPQRATSYPVEPDYPPVDGNYGLSVLSRAGELGATRIDRCNTEQWSDYYVTWKTASDAYALAETACTLGGCDPTGAICLTACTATEVYRAAVTIAEYPVEACDVHDGNIDGAEIEATYENVKELFFDVGALRIDLNAHDADLADHEDNLAAHEGNLAAHADNLATHENNLAAHAEHLATHESNLASHAAELAAHASDLNTHDGNLAAHASDLAAHDGKLAVHDGKLDAHDANIDTDLQNHDTQVQAKLNLTQAVLDDQVEFRRVHLQVLEVDNMKRYVVRASEAGVAVDVDFLAIEVFDEASATFTAIASANVAEIETGLYDVTFQSPGVVYRIRVRHDDTVDHFGEIIFHKNSVNTNS